LQRSSFSSVPLCLFRVVQKLFRNSGDRASHISVIDGKEIEITPEDENIVDVAGRAKIKIPAPCYIAKRKKGCCHSCVIEINGKTEYACGTKPLDGMSITFNREDLNEIRKEKIKAYRKLPELPKDPFLTGGCGCD